MADRHTDDDSSTELRTDGGERKDDPTGDLAGVGRRSFMKLAGAGAAIAATGAVGAASALEGVDADTVVDLGEEGLSDGDLIDPYLDEHFDDGVEVHVPAGEYDWGGGGFSGDLQNAAVIGQGEVILDTVEGQYRNVIVATGGTVAVKNFTVRGKVEASRVRIEAEEGARVVVDNWNFPDGAEERTSGRAFYCPGDHAGEAVIRNCYIRGFDDNGIYASSPGRDAGGRVVVENCFVHNNNIAGIRVGGRESVIRNCVVLNDGPAPVAESGHRNQRGIRIANYEHSVDMRIENVDVIHSSEELGGGGPIRWSNDEPLSSGHMQGVRVHNANSNVAAIGEKRDRAEDWTGDDITVSGDGDLDVPDWFTNVSTGDEITPTDPTEDGDSTTTDESDGTDSDGDSADTDSDEGDSTEDGDSSGSGDTSDGGETELVLVSTDSDGLEYTFTATGEITPLYDRDSYRANRSAPGDEAVENDDGTWTATGATAGGSNESGDSFLFEGGLTEFSATGDVDALTVYADGEEVSIDELTEKYGVSDEDVDESTEEDDTADDTTDGSADEDETADEDTSSDEGDRTLSNHVIVDGTRVDSIASYTIEVSGDIEPADSISSEGDSRWDETDDIIEDGSVTGVVAKGIDGFRYSGEVTSFSVDGVVDVAVDSAEL